MKQKQAKGTPKVAKEAKSAGTPKRVLENVEKSDEEVAEEQVFTKTSAKKKPAKIRKIAVEESTEKENQNEENEVQNEDEGKDVEVEEDKESGDDDDDSDESIDTDDVSLYSTDSESNNLVGVRDQESRPPKVGSGEIPPTISKAKIIYVRKLPEKCKQINIIEAFSKFGRIKHIHIVTTPSGTCAHIVFNNAKAAKAAVAEDNKVQVMDTLVRIRMHKDRNSDYRERTIQVKNLKTGTTEKEICEYFESCGEVESVKLMSKFHFSPFGYVTFDDKSSVPAALKLHNAILNGINIRVYANTEKKEDRQVFEELTTVVLKNKQSLECVDIAKLESIFSKCGEIDNIDIMCKKNIIGFITFKTEEAAQEALKLSGQTQEEIELELEPFTPYKKWTSVHVINIPKDCTEEDLTKHFAKAGEIANVIIRKKFAIIRFNDSDGYCKSFLYNESFIKGQIIFVEPHSPRKKAAFLKKTSKQQKGFRRGPQNGYSVFTPKIAKTG